MKALYLAAAALMFSMAAISQNTGIKGVIKDSKTKETLVGASVMIQGTTIGASTDLDGNYIIKNVTPGTYNLVVSYISYKTLVIDKIKVVKGQFIEINADLEENSMSLEGVVISAQRKTGTDVSLLNTIKSSNLVVNGISSQQINRSQDRDASEVIRRIPGITIMDDRFVMVRGLNQRYNTVWLNNVSTPSAEPDVRAFSFDIIPSSMIDNMLIYKSPAPDLPADFSGATIKIFTKSDADDNSFSLSYSSSYQPGTTFNNYLNYSISKYDWLGFDDGSRSLPSDFPDHLSEIKDKTERQKLGREMNKVWDPQRSTAIPDQRLQANLLHRFVMGKVSVGTINSLNYSYVNDRNEIYRADYQTYDTVNDVSDTNYYFNDIRYRTTVKVGGLSNWSFIFGKNQKIEFRNLYNHIGYNQYIDRSGRDNYGGLTIISRELSYSSRSTYSGQLAGDFTFGKQNSHLTWTAGYSYADRIQPDQKRLTTTLVEDPESQYYGSYGVNFSFAATPELSGRVYQQLHEHIYSGNVNFEQKIKLGEFIPEIKAGVHLESKNRDFEARNIGYAISSTTKFDWSLPYKPVYVIFSDTNINTTTGVKIDETTNKSDSYSASNMLEAGYLAIHLPFSSKINLYTGVRIESNRQLMHSYSSDNASAEVDVDINELHAFPSANFTYNFTKKSLLRLSYGMTINRPEFREIAPFAYYDFELKKLVRGNPEVDNSIINNYDLRYEYYPSPNETVALGLFYKDFSKPIEVIEINSGSGKDYTYQNALGANNYGVELEVKKSFARLADNDNFLRLLKNVMVVANASLVKSEIQIDTSKYYAQEVNRPMQGQSPFIVNLGVYYQDDKAGLMISLLYNVIGKRIVTVGLDLPDVYEMPRNSLDLLVIKEFGQKFQVKAGIQDLLNEKIVEQQYVEFTNTTGEKQTRTQSTLEYRPGRLMTAGVTVKF